MFDRYRALIFVLTLAGAFGASVAAQSADVTLTDLSFTTGPLTYRIPTLVVHGTDASREQLTRLLDPATSDSLHERLRTIDAQEIDVPGLTLETGPADGRVTITIRDIRASGIKGGRVASIAAGVSEVSAKVADGIKVADNELRGGTGRMAIQDLDLALATSLAQPGTGGSLQSLYASASLDALTISDGKGVTLRLDRLTSREVQARPSALGWDAAITALSSRTGPVPTERLAAILADWAGSVEFGSFEAGGLAFELAGPDRQAARIGRIAYAQGTKALDLEGVEVGGTDGRLTIGTVTLGDLSPRPGAAVALGGPGLLGGLLPGSGSIRLDSVALAGPDGNAVTIGRVELGVTAPATASDPKPESTTIHPTAFSFAARDIAVPLRPQDPGLKPLTDLGYAALAGSFEGAGTYDKTNQEMSIAGLKLRADDLGEVALGASFTRVSPDLFQQDTTRAAMAVLGMRTRRLDVTVQNGGLAERLVDRQARLSGTKTEDVRRQYGAAAGFGVMMALGTSPGAQTLGNALARFVTKPGRLRVTLTAKDAAGLGMADLVMGPDPRAILDRVEVAATAE